MKWGVLWDYVYKLFKVYGKILKIKEIYNVYFSDCEIVKIRCLNIVIGLEIKNRVLFMCLVDFYYWCYSSENG